MIILTRKDVEISRIQHPTKEGQITILTYQGQKFRLISVFAANQEKEAKNFWRDLTDNRGKFCVLLQESEQHSVWGKISLDQLGTDADVDTKSIPFTQACLILLQTVYLDIEDLLGARQAKLFQKDLTSFFEQWHFPQADNAKAVAQLLEIDPLKNLNIPTWEEHHLINLLQELHRLGKEYFGNDNFAEGMGEILADMPQTEINQFFSWLNQSPLGKLWRE